MKKVGIVGIGKLGLCFALNLERKGFDVIGVDVDENYVNMLKTKNFDSDEPNVKEFLAESTNFFPTTDYSALKNADIIFVLVATPSKLVGSYDHTYINIAAKNISKVVDTSKHRQKLVIGCTTMPGFCEELQKKYEDTFDILYNPEFIAQGTVIRDQLFPDMVLIGTQDPDCAQCVLDIYEKLVDNSPRYNVMTLTEAEITKLALNCYLTTKIAYANMVGDVAAASGVRPDVILTAIGADSRIGEKYLKYGHGFGGPCFPRDNRAFSKHAESVKVDAMISKATDMSNVQHLKFMGDSILKSTDKDFEFDYVTYKPESTMLVESQQLQLALYLARMGRNVTITERPSVIKELKQAYGETFNYVERTRL